MPTVNWEEVARDLAGALDTCVTQIQQMKGMFSDDDGNIEQALQDASEADASYAKAHDDAKVPTLVQSITDRIRHAVDKNVLDNMIHDQFADKASEMNNAGLDAQILYLMSNGYDEQQILEKAEINDNPFCSR